MDLPSFLLGCDAQVNGPKIETLTSIDYTYEVVTDNIDDPWGLTFLNNNELLVTEKAGILYHVVDGKPGQKDYLLFM